MLWKNSGPQQAQQRLPRVACRAVLVALALGRAIQFSS
jgi:hypothetical protein